MTPIAVNTVVLVDDDPDLLSATAQSLELAGWTVVACSSGAKALQAITATFEGVVMTDIRMPQMSGLALQEWLAMRKHDIPIIFITGHGDIPMAVGAMRFGAIDFIETPIHDQKLLDSIQLAIQRDASNRSKRLATRDLELRMANLTAREHKVLALLMEGMATKAVARELNLSHRTVEGYRGRIFEKTGVGSLAELINLHRRTV